MMNLELRIKNLEKKTRQSFRILNSQFIIRGVSCAITIFVLVLPLRQAICAGASGPSKGEAGKTETWRLDGQGQWQKPDPCSGNRNEEFLLRVAQMKKLVDAGRPAEAQRAAKQLKADFPEIAGKDFDTFTDAEVLLAQGKLTKAVTEYDKLLNEYPGSGLCNAALEREYQIATDFLNGRKKSVLWVLRLSAYDDGVKIMEKISDRMGGAEIALRSLLTLARSYEKKRMFNEAYLTWSQISKRWPTGKTGEDALLAMAKDKYATFHGPQYDGSGLISARTYYENFKLRYPEEAQRIKVDEILTKIGEQLAEKNLLIAKYYERTGSAEPAHIYYQLVVDSWPNTKAAQEARQKISKK